MYYINRLFMMYLKLALVLVYAFGRSNLSDQAIAFWGMLTIWMMWTCTRLPYRCRSSNRRDRLKYLDLFFIEGKAQLNNINPSVLALGSGEGRGGRGDLLRPLTVSIVVVESGSL